MGNNTSVSDLSIYQTTFTKIAQDLNAQTSNINDQKAEGSQIITFTNGPGLGNCSKVNQHRENFIKDCKLDCNTLNNLGGSFVVLCRDNCSTQAIKTFPDCTPEQIMAEIPKINGCEINITQNMEQDLSSTQIATSFIDSKMTAKVVNDFENEIDKLISQTNSDFNFLQNNVSKERTRISQDIRNEISNSIQLASQNQNSAYTDGKQIVEFVNQGTINCCKPCEEENCTQLTTSSDSNCSKIKIDQNLIQTIKNNQTATSVLKSVFDSDVLNKAKNDYALKVSQINKGIDPFGFLYGIAAIVGVIVIGIAIAGGNVAKILNSTGGVIIVIFILVIITIIIVLYVTSNNSFNSNLESQEETINKPNGQVKTLIKKGALFGQDDLKYFVDNNLIDVQFEPETIIGIGEGLILKLTVANVSEQLIVTDIVHGGENYKVNDEVEFNLGTEKLIFTITSVENYSPSSLE